MSKTRRETTTRTFRINADYDRVMLEESERRGQSVNALMDQVLQRYVESFRYQENQMSLSFSNTTFTAFLDKLTDDEVKEIAHQAGIDRANEGLLMRGKAVDFENVIWFVKQVLGEYNGWFRCEVSNRQGSTLLYLRHSMGYRWSLFLHSYVASIFKESLDITPNASVMRNSVNLEIRKKT